MYFSNLFYQLTLKGKDEFKFDRMKRYKNIVFVKKNNYVRITASKHNRNCMKSVKRPNTGKYDQKNSVFGHFSLSVYMAKRSFSY